MAVPSKDRHDNGEGIIRVTTMWITKDCLRGPIYETEGNLMMSIIEGDPDWFHFMTEKEAPPGVRFCKSSATVGREAFFSHEDAKAEAIARRKREITKILERASAEIKFLEDLNESDGIGDGEPHPGLAQGG